MEIETVLRKWGNSLGIVIPKKELVSLQLKANQKVRITLRKKPVTKVKDMLGFLEKRNIRLEKSTEEIMREIDAELDSKFFKEDV